MSEKTPVTHEPFKAISELYQDMDKEWDKVAAAYAFRCNGCEDNCCKSLFFHHTHIEEAYLISGFNRLDPALKENILKKANTYCEKTFPAEGQVQSLKLMCPLNKKGRCLLYAFRPMICRLHGLPHELQKPGCQPVRGDGCHAGKFDPLSYQKFDRTPFYRQMAQIELRFRKTANRAGNIRRTIAQMLTSQ